MKKAAVCLLIMLAIVVLGEPHVRGKITQTINDFLYREKIVFDEEVPLSFSDQLGGGPASDMLDVTLYYRFAGTDLLGMEQAQLDIRREETVVIGGFVVYNK